MSLQKQLRKARGFDVWLEVGRTNLKVHRLLNLMLGEVDLSLAQHEILLNIRRDSGLTQKELSDQLLVVKSNVTALIKKLEARGLVLRKSDPDDSRIKRLSLTRAGDKLVQQSFALQNQVVKAMVSVMSDAELRQMADVMARVGGAVDTLQAASSSK
jgi:DNA-binding MarR family transcriptional regulator